MSIASQYFNIPAAVSRVTGFSDTGDILRGEPEDIKIRFDPSNKELIDKEGNRITSTGIVITDSPLSPLDCIQCLSSEWTVKTAEPVYTLSGQIDHWEAYV
jgi:hypothetical protein